MPTLYTGNIYRGVFIINHTATMIAAGGGKKAIQNALEKAGFANVAVWYDDDTLPADWPPSKVNPPDSGWLETVIWAEGTWAKGAAQMPMSGADWRLDHPTDVWLHRAAARPAPGLPEPPKPATQDPTPPPADVSPPVRAAEDKHPTWLELAGIVAGVFSTYKLLTLKKRGG